MGEIFLRTVVMYLFLIIALRLMGKRQVGELEISELVITFMLSELAVVPIAENDIPLTNAIIPILTLLSLEVALSFFISRSSLFKKLLLGAPVIVVRNGEINQIGLKKLRMSPTELMSELRLKGVSALDDVAYAIIEDNGKLSVFEKKSCSPITAEQLDIETCEDGISHTVMVDGKIYKDNLPICRKSEKWILHILKERNLQKDDIYLMTVNDDDKITIIMKEHRHKRY